MKSLKHLTMWHADPEVDAFLDKFGARGYGTYWLIIEEIGSLMEPGQDAPEAIHSAQRWASICRVPPRVFREIVAELNNTLLNVSETDDDRLRIVAPKLLQWQDEYSRKSGHSPDSTRTRSRKLLEGDLALARDRLTTGTGPPQRIPAQTSQSIEPFQRIAANGSSSRRPVELPGLKLATVPPKVSESLNHSEVVEEVELLRRELDAINRDRFDGRLPEANRGTAENILRGVRQRFPGAEVGDVVRLLIEGPLNDRRRLRPESWGLIVTVARNL